MILQGLLEVIYSVMSALMVLNIPDLPPEVQSYIDTLFEYLTAGGSILANYVPLGYLLTLFGVILAVDAGILIYHFVMWIIRKIPMLGVS